VTTSATSPIRSSSPICMGSRRRQVGRVPLSTRSGRSSGRSRTRSPAGTICERSSTISMSFASAPRPRSTNFRTCTKRRSSVPARPPHRPSPGGPRFVLPGGVAGAPARGLRPLRAPARRLAHPLRAGPSALSQREAHHRGGGGGHGRAAPAGGRLRGDPEPGLARLRVEPAHRHPKTRQSLSPSPTPPPRRGQHRLRAGSAAASTAERGGSCQTGASPAERKPQPRLPSPRLCGRHHPRRRR